MDFVTDLAGGSNRTAADPFRPSLFELVAVDQLRDLLQPALKYILATLAQRHPRYLLRIVNRHEEFYAAIMFFVERHYLREHSASFAEHFYGLKRRRKPVIETPRANAAVGGIPAGEKLRRLDIFASLVFLVGVPYVRAKAQEYYEILGGGVDDDLVEESPDARRLRLAQLSLSTRLKRLFKVLYPYVNTAYELWLLSYNLLYLFDKTPFYRPWLRLIGVDLRRLGPTDYQQPPPSDASPESRSLLTLLKRTPHALLSSLQYALPTSIFVLKFLEWFYAPSSPARALLSSRTFNSSGGSASSSTIVPPIPPPKTLSPHPAGVQVDEGKYGTCPMCGTTPWEVPTALPSGYVFCYKCVYELVTDEGSDSKSEGEKDTSLVKGQFERGVCPVTKMDIGGISGLRRVLV